MEIPSALRADLLGQTCRAFFTQAIYNDDELVEDGNVLSFCRVDGQWVHFYFEAGDLYSSMRADGPLPERDLDGGGIRFVYRDLARELGLEGESVRELTLAVGSSGHHDLHLGFSNGARVIVRHDGDYSTVIAAPVT